MLVLHKHLLVVFGLVLTVSCTFEMFKQFYIATDTNAVCEEDTLKYFSIGQFITTEQLRVAMSMPENTGKDQVEAALFERHLRGKTKTQNIKHVNGDRRFRFECGMKVWDLPYPYPDTRYRAYTWMICPVAGDNGRTMYTKIEPDGSGICLEEDANGEWLSDAEGFEDSWKDPKHGKGNGLLKLTLLAVGCGGCSTKN